MPVDRFRGFGRGINTVDPPDRLPEFVIPWSINVRHYGRRLQPIPDSPTLDVPGDAEPFFGDVMGFIQYTQSDGTNARLAVTENAVYRLDSGNDQWSTGDILNPENVSATTLTTGGSDTVTDLPDASGEWRLRFEDADGDVSSAAVGNLVRVTSAGSGGPWRGEIFNIESNSGPAQFDVAFKDSIDAAIRTEWNDGNNLTYTIYQHLTGTYSSGFDWTFWTEGSTNWLIMVNDSDTPWEWDGSGQFSEMSLTVKDQGGSTVSSFTAKYVEKYNNFLCFGNTTEDGTSHPMRLRTSALADRTNFDASGSGPDDDDTATVQTINEGQVQTIMSLTTLQNSLVIMGDKGFSTMSFVGLDQTFPFRRRLVVDKNGLFFRRGWARLKDGIAWVAKDGVYFWSGGSPRRLDRPVRNKIMAGISRDDNFRTQVFHEKERDELWFFFKRGGNDLAWVLNWRDSERDPVGPFSHPVWYPVDMDGCRALGAMDIDSIITWEDLFNDLSTDGTWEGIPGWPNSTPNQWFTRLPFVPVWADSNNIYRLEGKSGTTTSKDYTRDPVRAVAPMTWTRGGRGRKKWCRRFMVNKVDTDIESGDDDITYTLRAYERVNYETEAGEQGSGLVDSQTELTEAEEADITFRALQPEFNWESDHGELHTYEIEYTIEGED